MAVVALINGESGPIVGQVGQVRSRGLGWLDLIRIGWDRD